MLKFHSRHWRLVIAFGILALFLFAVHAGWVPWSHEICEQDAEAGGKTCTDYDPALVIIWQAFEILKESSEAIIALGTIALAIFTATLWRATDRLLASAKEDGERMERSIAEAAKAATAMEGVAASTATNALQLAETVEINRSIGRAQRFLGEAQLRANVSVLVGGFARLQHETGLRFETQPLMRNTGHTAARNLRWRVRCAVLPNPIPKGFRFPIPAPQEGSALLPPGETITMTAIMEGMVNDELVYPAAANASGWGFFVWGYVIYEDIFRHTHRTTFCQQIIFAQAGPMDQNWNYPAPAIHGLYLAKHNRAN